jgi:peptidoglycan-associated lipoprotein
MKLRKSIIILCLINSGVNPKRIETISYGMERPLDPAHNEESWAKNRRDNFVINN